MYVISGTSVVPRSFPTADAEMHALVHRRAIGSRGDSSNFQNVWGACDVF